MGKNLKPLNNLDEHDTYNFFALNTATGAKGTPVVISNGWNNAQDMAISSTALQGNPNSVNIFTPRWEVQARVRAAVSGEKPFGVTLYDTLEHNQYGTSLLYDKQRREELQCALSGQAVPITRKGLLLVGPFTTGEGVAAGKYAVVKGTGDWGVASAVSGAAPAAAFGEFIGGIDNQGYAAVIVNCYL